MQRRFLAFRLSSEKNRPNMFFGAYGMLWHVKLLPWIPVVFSLASGEERPSERVVLVVFFSRRFATRLRGFVAQFSPPQREKKNLWLPGY